MRKIAYPVILLVVFSVPGNAARAAAADALEVSIVGQTSASYKRQKQPDGTFKPEGYAFTNGGLIPGTIRDKSVEKVPFPAIAEVVARHLAKQNYFLAEKAGDFNLLIVLHWGGTTGFEDTRYSQSVERSGQGVGTLNQATENLKNMQKSFDIVDADAAAGVTGDPEDPGKTRQAEDLGKLSGAVEGAAAMKQRAVDNLESSVTMTNLANRERDSANLENAKVLGYLDAINARRSTVFSTVTGTGNELMRDVEEKRYFVILTAYDFRTVRDKKKAPLWVTRISIRASGNSFDERMAQMIASAAGAFGRKSELSRKYYRDPRVELGEVEYLGVAASAPAGAGEKPDK